MTDMQDVPGAVQFEAVIVPHRSLSARGLRLLLGALCAGGGALAIAFLLLGAWPVMGFTGVELALAAFLLRLNARGARASEMLLLTESSLRIVRTDATGRRQEQVAASAWLNVLLEDRPGRVPALYVVARDVREEIGSALGEADKRDLAASLAAALDRRRHPLFVNPQLED